MYAVLYLMLHGIIWFSLSRYQSGLVTRWSVAGIVSATGIALLACEGVLPEWVVAGFGQTLMAAGNFARQHVLRSLDESASRRWVAWNGGAHLAYLAFNGGLFASGASHKSMMLVFFVFYALICVDFFFAGRAIWLRRGTLGAVSIQFGGIVFSVSLALKSMALVAGWGAQDLYAPGWDQVALFAAQILAISLLNFGFVQLLVNQFQQEHAQVELALAQQRQQALEAQLKSIDLAALLRERDEIIRQLTLSNKTAGMGALVASIAHEINQPLTTIVLKAELIDSHLGHAPDIDQARALSSQIRDDTYKVGAIIRTLRNLFTLGKGPSEKVDLSLLVQELLTIVRGRAERLGIDLQADLAPHTLLAGDATQLQQVVLNLLNNAIEAVAESGVDAPRIQVRCQVRQGQVELSVQDNGLGIDPERREDIFALFKTSKSGGMGVGLWLSQAIVNAHGGQLGFESTPGQGAVFFLRLPVHHDRLVF